MPITKETTTTAPPSHSPSKISSSKSAELAKVDEHFIAKETITAEQFIPHFLDTATAQKIVKNAGVVGTRAFNCPDYAERFNPYLMMSDITIGEPLVFPDHPHFGHDMMLYVLDGEFIHEDFLGCKESFKEGDLHWMSTGRGIIHAQAPGSKISKNRHVQFWINVPRSHKNDAPSNQVLRSSSAPQWTEDKMSCKLLVGSYKGKSSSIKTSTPLLMLDIVLAPGAKGSIEIPAGHFVGTYTITGINGLVNGKSVGVKSVTRSRSTAATTGTRTVQLENRSDAGEAWRFLLFSGEPINEPVAANGFFVGCSKEETQKTIDSFEQRTAPFTAGKTWSSTLCHK